MELAAVRLPNKRVVVERIRVHRWFCTPAVIAGALLTILAGVSYLRFGSVSAGLSYLAGERLIVDSRNKDFGQVGEGRDQTVRFRLTNLTGKAVRIIGAESSCTCVIAEDLPVTVQRAANATLTVAVRKGTKPGAVNETIRFYTDCVEKPQLSLRVVGYSAE